MEDKLIAFIREEFLTDPSQTITPETKLISSGLVIWERYFGGLFSLTQQRIAMLVHAVAAIAAICVWIVHVYAAIWVQGTISAMTRGQVTGGWAWRHHRKWLRELVTSKR